MSCFAVSQRYANLTHVRATVEKGYAVYTPTFRKRNFEEGEPAAPAQVLNGPQVVLQYERPHHFPPGPKNSIDKAGPFIDLPLSLGFIAAIAAGLLIGMRRQRIIAVVTLWVVATVDMARVRAGANAWAMRRGEGLVCGSTST
ncbi:hypothetical protein PMIN06_008416 [Paraphaeosphaeria minitans]